MKETSPLHEMQCLARELSNNPPPYIALRITTRIKELATALPWPASDRITALEAENRAQAATIAALRTALEIFANSENWRPDDYFGTPIIWTGGPDDYPAKLARAALAAATPKESQP